jgi:hypothetical protein
MLIYSVLQLFIEGKVNMTTPNYKNTFLVLKACVLHFLEEAKLASSAEGHRASTMHNP